MEIYIPKHTGGSSYRVSSRTFLGVCVFLVFIPLLNVGCTLFASRPVQEMSYTAAAIRAAKEVQADTLAPEYFRQANEWFFKAKNEYKFKNFSLAREYTDKARFYAEQAEFESLRNGGVRSDQGGGGASDPLAKDPLAGKVAESVSNGEPSHDAVPYSYPTPTGTPADVYDQKKAQESQQMGSPPSGGGGSGPLGSGH